MNQTIKTIVFWLVIVISATILWQVVKSADTGTQPATEISYSQFFSQVEAGNVIRITISGIRGEGTYRDGSHFRVTLPASQEQLLEALRQRSVEIRFTDSNSSFYTWLVNLAPLILLVALWFYMLRQIQKKKNTTSEGQSATGNAPWPQS